MSATRLYAFRQGDRSEYLAVYVLSAFGLVTQVPRQEDIGIDFHCTLTAEDGPRLTYGSSLVMQAKSSSANNALVYGGKDDKGKWKEAEVKWLFGQRTPLFLALVDKKKAEVSIYSTSSRWMAQVLSPTTCAKVVLAPDNPRTFEKVEDPQLASCGDGQVWTIGLGGPVIRVPVADTEDRQKVAGYLAVLTNAVRLEERNILWQGLGVRHCEWIDGDAPNDLEAQKRAAAMYGTADSGSPVLSIMNIETVKRSMMPLAVSLALQYSANGDTIALGQLGQLAKLLPVNDLPDWIREALPEWFPGKGSSAAK